MASTVWGLDIGQASIKAVKMERAGSVAQVTSFDVIEVEPGEDESTRPARTQAAMAELLGRRKIGHDPVIVAVPGNQTFFRPFELPPAPASRLAGIVGFEARNQIPFPINEVIWDFKQLAPSDDGQMRVGLIAVRRELVDQIIALVRQFHLRLEAIQVAPFALYNLVYYELGDNRPWLVLDGGARVTDFVVVDGEEFWFRPLPQSGNDFTRCLEQKFRMTFEEAEELKLKMGGSKQAQQIFQVIEPMLRNMAGDIQRTIGYYKGIRKDANIQDIIAVGSAFRLPGMLDFLGQALDTKIDYLSQLRRIRVGPGVDAAWWQEELPSMAVALGLGIQGLGLAPVALELLPETIRQERMLRRKRPVVALGVALALAASVVGLLASMRERRVLEGNLAQIQSGLAKVQKFAKLYETEKAPTNALDQELKAMSGDTARDRGWVLECLNMITGVKGQEGAVLGVGAVEGNGGVYLKNVVVTRSDPFTGGARGADNSIVNWYQEVTGKGEVRPLVAIIQAEVAGPSYKGNEQEIRPSTARAQALREALRFSSRVYLKDDADLAAQGITEKVLKGCIHRTEEDRAAGRISFYAAPGAEPKQIEMKHVKRLAWLRNVRLAAGWTEDKLRANTPEEVEAMTSDANAKGTTPIFDWRNYLYITIGLVCDDGSTELKGEAEAAPR